MWCEDRKWLSTYLENCSNKCIEGAKNDPDCTKYIMWTKGTDKRYGCSERMSNRSQHIQNV